MNRRNFLVTAAASIATTALSVERSYAGQDPGRLENQAGSSLTWSSVRDAFDLLTRDHIHMSSFFLASHPRVVRDEIERHRRGIDANPFEYVEANIYTMPGKVQAAAAEYLGGKPDEVALTNSTTMGLALVYQGLPLKAGDEVLTTTHDHFVHHEAIRLSAERSGAAVRKIALFDDIRTVTGDEIVSRIKRSITPKTRVLGITWVHSSTGLKLPIRAIAAAVAEINRGRSETDRLIVIVDGVHGFGVEDVSVAQTGVDFFIAGTHKWIFGPRGTGIIWAKAENWKLLKMVFPAFAMETFGAWMADSRPTGPMRASWVGQGGFHAFEYEWALPAAFAFHKQIGRGRVAARIHELNDQCKAGLAAMRHVRLHTPLGSELSAGLICFGVDGLKPQEVVRKLLAQRIVASTSPYRDTHARLAPSLVNSPEEVEATLRQVRALG